MAAPKSQHGIILDLLSRFERGGINAGGLSLIALGLYGGQYAALFPETIKNVAGGFCIFVAAVGLAFVIYHLVKAASRQDATEENRPTATQRGRVPSPK